MEEDVGKNYTVLPTGKVIDDFNFFFLPHITSSFFSYLMVTELEL